MVMSWPGLQRELAALRARVEALEEAVGIGAAHASTQPLPPIKQANLPTTLRGVSPDEAIPREVGVAPQQPTRGHPVPSRCFNCGEATEVPEQHREDEWSFFCRRPAAECAVCKTAVIHPYFHWVNGSWGCDTDTTK